MWKEVTAAAVVEGVVIGVSSGVILGVVTWVIDVLKRRREWRSQVRYLVEMVAVFRKRTPRAEDMTNTGLIARKAFYDSLKFLLEEALQRRADRLSFDEKKQIELAIETADVDFQKPYSNQEVAKRQDDALKNLFNDLDKIDWLKEPSVLKRLWGLLWGKLRALFQKYS